MTPQEINEAVVRKLGWDCCYRLDAVGWHRKLTPEGNHFHEPIPDYSTSIAAAWEIVEKLLNEGHGIRLYGRQGFTVNIDGWEETADTAPMAICLAFLKLEDINGSKTKDS